MNHVIKNVVLAKIHLEIAQIVNKGITYRIQVVYFAITILNKRSIVLVVFKVVIVYNVQQICIY